MKQFLQIILFGMITIVFHSCKVKSSKPFALHPENSKYFQYKGKPTLLVGSTEHYGALMNLDFDYKIYLENIKSDGLNTTRLFTGVYTEAKGFFGIVDNTMAVDSGRLISPWARSEIPGYKNGGNKFDLSKWDDAYFNRLHDFMKTAIENDVIVEIVLFSNNYNNVNWQLSPMHQRNNINIRDSVEVKDVLRMKHKDLYEFQSRFVKKMVTELNRYDNFYYEVCNEPYIFGFSTDEWQNAIIDTIVKTQLNLPKQHLISINYGNGSHRIEKLHPKVSIVNFHYVSPPSAVAMNADINAVIGHNETGGRRVSDRDFVREGWDFIVAGGAIFNHLDYSFTVKQPSGDRVVAFEEPSAGGPQLRKELKHLREFMESLNFIKMNPDTQCVKSVLSGRSVRVISNPGKEYGIFIRKAPSTAENKSLTFKTRLLPDFSDEYTFHISCNDGARVYFDGKLMINLWKDWGSAGSFKCVLEKGKTVDVLVEYYKKIGPAALRVEWETKSLAREEIPAKNYLLPDKDENGVSSTLFNDPLLGVFVAFNTLPIIAYSGSTDEFSGSKEVNNILKLSAVKGTYRVELIDIETGKIKSETKVTTQNGLISLNIDDLDIAIRINKI